MFHRVVWLAARVTVTSASGLADQWATTITSKIEVLLTGDAVTSLSHSPVERPIHRFVGSVAKVVEI